jgi:hypothetical protein
MTQEERQAILAKIKTSIASHGYHVRIVDGGPSPRFTFGLCDSLGFEIVLAGASFYTLQEARSVVNEIARSLQRATDRNSPVDLAGLGTFSLREVDSSWSRKVLLGAVDYFGSEQIKAMQIVPDYGHWTGDIPNMAEPWNPLSEPAWKWLEANWELPISPKSVAVTNLDALRGHAVTEMMRWEEGEWEMFSGAGPDVDKNDIRTVPLATLVALDATLECATSLVVGSGLWREEGSAEWHSWGQ